MENNKNILRAAIPNNEVDAAEIDKKSFFKLSYGLFVLTACEGDRHNGCIINTAQQVTSEPSRISIAVNKQNYTHDMIMNTGVFNLSILSEEAKFDVFTHFGFQSGREVEKIADYVGKRRSANRLYYLNGPANAFISGKVCGTVDCGTHTLFVADVTEAKVLNEVPAMTYAYYFANVKPKPEVKKADSGRVWVCKICGYQYDEAKEGIPFEQLPADWVCPLCKHPKSDFELMK